MEEDDRSTFVAPQAKPVGQPSAETMARLHAAATKAPAARREATAPAEKPRGGGFGLNSLISKMTGHNDERHDSNRVRAEQPSLVAQEEEQVYEEPAMTEDQERIEIPAFLRRQAN
jgi:cell division protein FtsZ